MRNASNGEGDGVKQRLFTTASQLRFDGVSPTRWNQGKRFSSAIADKDFRSRTPRQYDRFNRTTIDNSGGRCVNAGAFCFFPHTSPLVIHRLGTLLGYRRLHHNRNAHVPVPLLQWNFQAQHAVGADMGRGFNDSHDRIVSHISGIFPNRIKYASGTATSH
jgi:hypothetical protein